MVTRLRDRYLEQPPPPFDPLSSLGRDEADVPLTSATASVPMFSPWSFAWSSLGSCAQHLEALRLMLVEAQAYVPVAAGSLLRGGLMASSQALYVLAPPRRAQRTQHFLAVHREEMQQQLRTWVDMRELADARDAPPQSFLDELETSIRVRREAIAVIEAAQVARGVPQGQRVLSSTTAVKWALGHMWPEDVTARVGLLSRYRALSGQAHGLTWTVSAITARDVRDSPDRADTVIVQDRYDPDSLATDVMGVLALVLEADRLFEARRRRP